MSWADSNVGLARWEGPLRTRAHEDQSTGDSGDTCEMEDQDAISPNPTRSIITLPFDQRSVSQIAHLLGATTSLAPFQLPGGEVHQLTLKRAEAPPTLLLTLWPTIRRVDAISKSATVVFTNVTSVDLVEGVEVLFRRGSREYLIVTVAGKVIVRA